MSLNKRYFDMRGGAYEVPSEAGRFDAFREAAMAYFFAGRRVLRPCRHATPHLS